MSFISFSFAIFFAIVLVARVTIGRAGNEKSFLYFLLFASLIFYAWHVPIYVFILITSAMFNFVITKYIDNGVHKRLYLLASVSLNIGVLGFFKYFNFLIDVNNKILTFVGLEPSILQFSIILPIGISFYTFQSMSYSIDVYRGHIKPVSNFATFLLYISFFPQLVAGPIVRAKDFLYQISRKRQISLLVWGEGIYLIILGFFLKIVVGDNLGVLVDKYWGLSYSNEANSSIAILSLLFFSMQILADFAGYTSIARGIAYLLGFRLPINFNAPYIATSFSNFWNRWHISLSQWLRDYLYISLGGNKVSKVRGYINLLLVMLIAGLWHGAAYVFIAWGFIHGIALVTEHAIRNKIPNLFLNKFFVFFWFLIVQLVVLIAWVYFRSDTFEHANQYVGNILNANFTKGIADDLFFGTLYLIPIIIYHLRIFLAEQFKLLSIRPIEKIFVSGILVYMILTMHTNGKASFIYFQF